MTENLSILFLSLGEVYEEQTWSSHGGDGRLLRSGPCHHSSKQQLSLCSEIECVVSTKTFQLCKITEPWRLK